MTQKLVFPSLFLLVVVGVIAAQDSTESTEDACKPEPCKCSRKYQPICGTNGKNYSNKCMLECERDQCNKNLQEAYKGQCKEKSGKRSSTNSTEGECKSKPCKCTREYHPICGTDQKTYSNPCLMECHRKQCNENLKTAHEGRCENESGKKAKAKPKKRKTKCKPKPCSCTKEYRPICGTDRRTYSNPCELKCNRKSCNKNLRSKYRGRCKTKSKKRSKANQTTKTTDCKYKRACKCTKDYRPICGTNQRTYGNKCMLNCDANCNPGLKEAYEGPCKNDTTDGSTNNNTTTKENCNSGGCACAQVYEPVCGSNNRTYSNRCHLRCDQNCNKSLQEEHAGECGTSKYSAKSSCSPNCDCDEEDDNPVCGTDKRTYDNTCMLKCHRKYCNKNLRSKHRGQCKTKAKKRSKKRSKKGNKTANCRNKMACRCMNDDRPVCGTNKRTYGNRCMLSCDTGCNPGLKVAHEGPCKNETTDESANSNARTKENCNSDGCACPEVYGPVCGSNNRTYSNQCELRCDQKCNKYLYKEYKGECTSSKSPPIDSCSPKCNCAEEDHNPICGNDQQTYNNTCLLKCNRKYCNKKLRRKHRGRCSKKSSKKRSKANKTAECRKRSCPCTREYRPICGTDKVTYGNKCLFRCDQKCSPGLKQAHEGACESETTDSSNSSTNNTDNNTNENCNPDGCICNQQYAPVCGSNNRTYSNRCHLRCDQNCKQDLQEAHSGVCRTSKSSPRKSCSQNCICDEEYDPVCGTNRKTYSNPCRLECDQQCNRKIKQAYKGECKKQSRKQTTKKPRCNQTCRCPYNYWPVCGSDGKTYSNECSLNCEKRCKKSLRMAYQGACGKQRKTTKKRPKPKTKKRRTTTTTDGSIENDDNE